MRHLYAWLLISISFSVMLTTCFSVPKSTATPARHGIANLASTSTSSTDVSLTAGTPTLIIPRGASGLSTITIATLNGLGGDVGLNLEASYPTLPNMPNATLSPRMVSVPFEASATSILDVSTTASTFLGVYTITIYASDAVSSNSQSISVAVKVVAPTTQADVDLFTSTSPLRLAPSSTGNLTVLVTSLNGHAGPVTLAAKTSATGLSLSVNPHSLDLGSGANATVTLTVNASSTVPVGDYDANVTASGTGILRSALAHVEVTASQTFNAWATPVHMRMHPEDSLGFIIQAEALNGFHSLLYISTYRGANGLSLSLFTSQMDLSPGRDAIMVTVLSSNETPSGSYILAVSVADVRGSVPGVTIAVLVDVTGTSSGQDLYLTTNTYNAQMSILQGSSANITLQLLGTGEPVQILSFSQLRVSPNPLIVPSNRRPPELSVSASDRIPVGLFNLLLLATTPSGLARASHLFVTVSPFKVNVVDSLTGMPGTTVSATVTVNAVSWFSGLVNLTLTGIAPGTLPQLGAASVTLGLGVTDATLLLSITIPSSTTPGNYQVILHGAASISWSTPGPESGSRIDDYETTYLNVSPPPVCNGLYGCGPGPGLGALIIVLGAAGVFTLTAVVYSRRRRYHGTDE